MCFTISKADFKNYPHVSCPVVFLKLTYFLSDSRSLHVDIAGGDSGPLSPDAALVRVCRPVRACPGRPTFSSRWAKRFFKKKKCLERNLKNI